MDNNKLKASALAALAMAFALFGDTFLYVFLPVNYASVGVPVLWVGILLSVNRFVRIFTNTAIVHLFQRKGLRAVTVLSAVTAMISTIGYGFADSVVFWLLCRVLWGLSYSALRTGTFGYIIDNENKGFALGMSRGIQEAGPMIILLVTPFLIDRFAGKELFFVLAAMSLPALLFAFSLPRNEPEIEFTDKGRSLGTPSLFNSLTLVSAMLIDGIVVLVLGILFIRYERVSMTEATILAAFYLGYRRVCSVALGLAGGWIADRFGMDIVFKASLLLVVIGLVFITCGWVAFGAVIIFTAYSINTAIAPGVVAKHHGCSLMAVAENATWRDIGAAIGTLLGGFLINASHISVALIISTCLLAVLFTVYAAIDRPAVKIMTWK